MPRLRHVLALTAVAGLAAAACSTGGGSGDEADGDDSDASTTTEAVADLASDAAPPTEVPDLPGGAAGYSHFVFELLGGEVKTTLVEGPRGPQVREPWSYQQLKALAASGDPIPEELELSDDDLAELVAQLDEAREATEKYRDIDVAIADGYRQTTDQVANMGEHWNRSGAGSRDFNPAEPDILMYVTNDDGEKELVGTSFVLLRSRVGDDHPDAFAGDLDNWHVHYNLCRGSGSDSIVTEEECRERGGNWQGRLGWMIHTWAAPGFDNQLGVFGMWNPTIWPVTDPGVLVGRSVVSPSDLPEGSALQPIRNFAFGEVTVDAGSEVVWSNSDSVAHTVNAGSQASPLTAFTSGVFAPGESYSVTFDEPGEYRYFCSLHPDMSGTVIVN